MEGCCGGLAEGFMADPQKTPKTVMTSFRGYRPQNQKIHWGIVLLGKIMIWLDIKYHALGYATQMTPQKGGIRRPRLRLI